MMNESKRSFDDDYLNCSAYLSSKTDENGFNRFESEGKFYFAFIDHQIVILRSEGYTNEAGRENGIASVIKNMADETRYATKQLDNGRWVLILKAGNHQEIARSCEEDTEDDVKSYLPSQRALMAAEFLRLASVEAGTVPQAGIAFGDSEADDYMICREYQEKYNATSVDDNGFIKFQHENTGKYYFAWVTETGEIILRSEGYPTIGARDNGLESVKKNRGIEERYKILESHGAYFLILKAGNHQEIGRSCLFNSEAEAKAFLPSERAKAAAALQLATLQTAKTNEADDYMICREYEEKYSENNIDENGFVKFQHENTGKYYFAWYNEDGEVILRSEGYPTIGARDNGLASVLKNRDIRERYKVEESHGAYFLVLKAGNHQEIGRSCPQDSETALWALLDKKREVATTAAPLVAAAAAAIISDTKSTEGPVVKKEVEKAPEVVAAPIASAPKAAPVVPPTPVISPSTVIPPATAAASGGSGFNWWWLLPLLLIPLFFMWKSCGNNKQTEVSVAIPPVETTPTPAVSDTLKVTEQTAVVEEGKVVEKTPPSCDLNWILFDFDQYIIKPAANEELQAMAKILAENPEYKGVLKAYTDARGDDDYNQRLSENRAKGAKDVLVSAGIDGSRISAGAFSEGDPIAKNTTDDSGRRFNRRVELYIQDANGVNICKSIPPSVPSNLQGN